MSTITGISESTPISLRPLTEADLPVMELLHADPVEASEFGFHGFRSSAGARRELAETGLLTQDAGKLAIVAAGEVVGTVGWRRVTTGPVSFTWSIGIGLVSTARGKGYGTAAQRALVDYLFAYTQANRIEAHTETGNLAEQKSLEKAGFTREGVVRGACFRNGMWRDMVAYSAIRADLPLGSGVGDGGAAAAV